MNGEKRMVTGVVNSAATGQPIMGACVTLKRWLWARSKAQEFEERTYSAVTQVDGSYQLEVELPDESARADEQWYAEVSALGFSPFDCGVRPISQRAGAPVNLRLAPGFALRGKVHDELGHPIAGVLVALMQSSSFSCQGVRTNSCSEATDADGAFEAEGLPLPDLSESQIVLALYHPHYERRFVHRLERLPRRGGEAYVEITMRRGMSVSGVVRDATGEPVADAELSVTAERFYAGDPGCSGPPAQYDLKSEADGSFAAHGLPRHRYWVTARHGDRLGAAAASLLESSCDDVEVRLDEGRSLAGRVLYADHRPAVDIEVRGRQYLAGVERTARTDASGRYRLDGLFPGLDVIVTAGPSDDRHFVPPRDDADLRLRPLVRVFGRAVDREGRPHASLGRVRLTLLDPGFAQGPEAHVSSDGRFHFENIEETESFLHVEPPDGSLVAIFAPVVIGPTDTDLGNVVLHAGVIFHGKVLDPGGAPVAGAEIHLESPRYLEGVAAKSDDGGVFSLGRLSTGRYQLRVSADGFATHHEAALSIEHDTERTVRLALGGSIVGRVLDGERAIDAQSLAVHRPAASRIASRDRGVLPERRIRISDAITDAEGRYRFGAVATGRWAVRCGLEEREVEVTEGSETRCDFSWPGEGEGFETP